MIVPPLPEIPEFPVSGVSGFQAQTRPGIPEIPASPRRGNGDSGIGEWGLYFGGELPPSNNERPTGPVL